jgi:single-stranded-DNA-specific exonuclease
MKSSVWMVSPARPEADMLAAELGIPAAIAQVLVNRKILTAEAARIFLYGNLEGLHDPYLMKDMAKAVNRIQQAIAGREKILIFGDYDVDGVLSVVMLFKALTSLGAEVEYFIPERLKDGYGIKEHHVEIPVQRGTGLVISVDCGSKPSSSRSRRRPGASTSSSPTITGPARSFPPRRPSSTRSWKIRGIPTGTWRASA